MKSNKSFQPPKDVKNGAPQGMPPFNGKPPKKKMDFSVLKRVIGLLFKSFPALLPISITCMRWMQISRQQFTSASIATGAPSFMT